MSLFIDTDNITNNENLIKAIKKNNMIARNIKKEINELSNIKLIEDKNISDKTNIDFDDEIAEEYNDDFEYQYYYDPIKNMLIDTDLEEMKNIISDNLPSKNNSNYFKIINRIKIEIFNEIYAFAQMYNETDDEEFKKEVKANIEFEKQKLEIIKEEETYKELQTDSIIENNIIFMQTNIGNTYALEDIKSINKTYYESFLELYQSIKNGTFKDVKRLTTVNNKVNSVSEVRGFKTRIIFDKIGKNTYSIIQIAIKKSDFDKGYKEALERRVSIYRTKKDNIVKQLNDEKYIKNNKEVELKLIETLSQNKKKVLMPNE